MNKKNIMPVFLLMTMMMFSFGLVSATECASQVCSAGTTLTLLNADPEIDVTDAQATITLNGLLSKTIYVVFNASDANGYATLNHSTAKVTLSRASETDRVSSSCEAVENSTLVSVMNCTVDMEFYDSAGEWSVVAFISDNAGGNAGDGNLETTIVNDLDYIDADNGGVFWASITSGTSNQEADSTIIFQNGGNQDYSAFTAKGYNATAGANEIPAASFGLGNATGLTGTQTFMVHDTNVDVFGSLAGLNDHGAAITEELFFYVDVPTATLAGEYTQSSSWVLTFSGL